MTNKFESHPVGTGDRLTRYKEALEEIKEGKGRYSMNQLEHASNTIEDMKELATDALKE